MSTTFGDRLRERRKSAGLSQEQLAENCGVSVQAVSKWETNLCYPEVRQLMGIADLFHTSVDFLLGRESAKDGWDELPDDGVLRVLQYRGRTLLRCDNCTPKEYIPLAGRRRRRFYAADRNLGLRRYQRRHYRNYPRRQRCKLQKHRWKSQRRRQCKLRQRRIQTQRQRRRKLRKYWGQS